MEKVYVAHTPYQLMAILNIITNSGEGFVHKILLAHANLKDYISINTFFPNIEFILEEKLFLQYKPMPKLLAHFNIVKNAIKLKKNSRQLQYLNKNIIEIFVPSDDIVCRVVYNRVKLLNKQVVLSLFDDGVSTYDLHTFRKIGVGELFYALFLDSKYSSDIQNLYCYKKNLVSPNELSLNYYEIESSKIVKEAFKKSINIDVSKYYGKKVIFLDQGHSQYDSVKKCLELLQKYFTKEEVLIKTHPRILASNSFDFETSNDGKPFEIIASKVDFSQCLIIAYSSGGVVTPMIMYNEKVGIAVVLISIDKEITPDIPMIQFFSRVRDKMGEDIVFMPNDIQELDNFLRSHQQLIGSQAKL